MKKLVALSVVLMVAAGLILGIWGRAPSPVTGAGTTSSQGPPLPAVSVLSVRPGVTAPKGVLQPPAISVKPQPVVSANLSQYRARKDFASLYQRLAGDSTPE